MSCICWGICRVTYFTSKQILPFDFAEYCEIMSYVNNGTTMRLQYDMKKLSTLLFDESAASEYRKY